MNKFYKYMSYSERAIFHSLYSKIFRDFRSVKLATSWSVNFADSKIDIPIQGDSLWLNWDTAISIVGHDVEIKSFYEKLLKSDFRPSCFFDIGANYGTHSILFLANGVRTITFEPNPSCFGYFKSMATKNDIQYELMEVAVGERSRKAQLSFPKHDTWLGSISDSYQNTFKSFNNLETIEVQVITLDDYVQERKLIPNLIKIDTEGFELNVLRGGKQTIDQSKPLIIFETNQESERGDLFNFFNSTDYTIYDLRNLKENLTGIKFLNSASSNFLAISKNHKILKDLAHFA